MRAPANDTSVAFPWYDGQWLRRYTRATAWLGTHQPEMLPIFLEATRALRTRSDFHLQHIPRVFDDGVLAKIVERTRTFTVAELELHEAKSFGRFVVHDDPLFTELQETLIGLVSDLAGEPVESNYNFMSLYSRMGICPVHMDAPEAKWTLDVCIEQSEPWPIHFSQIVPWPEAPELPETDWQRAIKESPELRFESVALEPNQAVLFSGSSQWHYRDPQAHRTGTSFCNLLFFHFVPKGTKPVLDWRQWPELFGVPELRQILEPTRQE